MNVEGQRVRGASELRTGAKRLLFGVLSVAWGYLSGITVLPFGSMPFGFAALGASSRDVPWVILGLLLATLTRADAYALLASYGVTLLLRAAFSLISAEAEQRSLTRRFFTEHISLRAISASAGALALGAYRLYAGDLLYYYLIGALISMLASAALTVSLYAVTPKRRRERRVTGEAWRAVALCTLAAFFAYALRGVVLLGVSLSVLFAMLATLIAVQRRGISFGVLISMCAGVFVSVSYAPLFILSAVCFAALRRVSVTLAAASTLGVGLAWGVYVTGISSLGALLGALLMAAVTYPVIDRLFLGDAAQRASTEPAQSSESAECKATDVSADVALARLDDVARRVKRLCFAFSSLSDALADTETRYAPESETRRTDTQAGGSLLAEIGEEGVVVTRKFSAKRTSGRRKEREERWEAEDGRAFARGESAAADFKAIADYLAASMHETQDEYSADVRLSDVLTEALVTGLDVADVKAAVLGRERRRVSVSASDARIFDTLGERMRRIISDELGVSVAQGETMEHGGRCYAHFFVMPPLVAEAACRARRDPSEARFCGDSLDVVNDAEAGKLYAFISDGMGSGRDAERASAQSVAFFKSLLPTGVSATGALDMLNGFLRERNFESVSECAASADLGEIDLVRARATFYKSGAAPTFVFRDGELFKLRARTLPIGILGEPDVATSAIDILPGDVIVMVSDGVTEGREECPELFEYIRSRILTHSAQQLADAIMDYSERRGCTDDASAVVIRIGEGQNL